MAVLFSRSSLRAARVVAAAAASSLLLLSLPGSAQDDRPNVVATFSILGDMVQNVGGDLIDLTVLVGADSDPHTYEPAPSDAATLAEGDLIFENGFEFETWLNDLVEASGSSATRVAVSEGITPLAFEEEHTEHEGEATAQAEATPEGEGEHDHEHEEGDPHVWQSPRNAMVMVDNIAAALAEADPANADAYRANADAYIAEIEALDATITEQVATIPEANRLLVTNHEALGYFAAAYNFEVVGTALGSVSTEAADPSAADVAALIESIRETGATAVFAENIANASVAEQVAAEAGVTFAPELYTDALGAPGTSGETYLGMMRHNADVIVQALTGGE